MTRRTPETASEVWTVANTFRPVTAVRSAIRAVARSRISPAWMTSGLLSRRLPSVSAKESPDEASYRICVTPGTTSSGRPSREMTFSLRRAASEA